ncbi:MAG: protein kinase, partial [Anaerolineae bacterium]|nr:protein kinase [Anaerolineae bacterium]
MSLAIGQILQNRYRILRQLGQGGMGSVWLAEDLRLVGRRCAIKANIPEANADAQVLTELRNQFYVEAKTLGALDHSNLPKVSDYFTAGDSEYLVMDFVEGENLQEVLDRHIQQFRMPLPEQAVLGWIDQVLDALEYLHRQRPAPIIHRDIKPGNIILTPTGVAKLVDFGLVKLLDHTGQSTAAALRGMGTPAYTALEQYPGNESHTDARTDLYALGATLYHLLTGTPPANVRDRLLSSRALEKPRRLNTKLSTRTEAAILKAIEVHPDQRFQTASQMRAALGGNSVQATVLPRKRGWAALIVMLFVFSLLAITVLAWINGWILPPTPTPTVFTVTIVASETATDTPVVSTPTSTVEPTTQPTAKETAIPTIPISTPTSTRAPTDTPTNIPTATPAAPMAVASGQTNLRAGPGTGYPVVGSLTAGREVKIIGKNEAGTWWQLDSEDGESVWVIANLVETTGAVDTVEVVAAPPTPTTAPTATPARPGLVADFEGGP